MSNKVLILLRGLPGSGKTTFAEFLSGKNCFSISADSCWAWDYTTDPRGFDREELKRAHERCYRIVEGLMERSDISAPIAVHNTFTTEREMERYYELAEKYGYVVFSLIVENRHNGVSEHNVPQDTLTKMRERFSIKL
jgi:predicted kinase